MSDGPSVEAPTPVHTKPAAQPSPDLSTESKKSVQWKKRRAIGGLLAAGAAFLARSKGVAAQIRPLPGYEPGAPHPGHEASSNNPPSPVIPAEIDDPALREAQIQERARSLKDLASFEADTEQLAATSQKALQPNAKPIKTISILRNERTSAWGDIDKRKDGSVNPAIHIYLKDSSPGTLDTAVVLTAEEIARIINQAHDGKPAKKVEIINDNVRNNLSDSDLLKVGDFFELPNYVQDPNVEIEEHGGYDLGIIMYTRTYGLLRTKSAEIMKKLEQDDLSSAAKEGICLILLTTLKATIDSASGEITPQDLGFNENHIKQLVKISGNKINFNFRETEQNN